MIEDPQTRSTARVKVPVPSPSGAAGDLPIVAGLTAAEAADRLQRDGFNELPSSRRPGLWALTRDVLREPMIGLLVAIGTTYLLLGDPKQAALLLASVFVVIGIELYQQNKTERALEALRDLSSPRALVIRDGTQQRISGREVVRGDVIVLAEGDRVAADAMLLWALNLSADESLLTGESVPVRKIAARVETEMGRPGGDDLPCVYAGSLVVSGRGVAVVRATAVHTEMGRIGRALQSVEPEPGGLRQETTRLVRVFAAVGIAVCVMAALAYGALLGDWLEGTLIGLTLAISMTPEEFPVVLTVFLALGAWRMSQRRVLARRVHTIETLGAATVLCVDKTGTLTQNRMTVSRLWTEGHMFDVAMMTTPLPEVFHALLEFAVLASQRDPFDPMERAFTQFAGEQLANTEHLHNDWTLVHAYPLSPDLLALSHVWQSPDATRFVIAAKGAPEAIIDLCHLDTAAAEVVAHQASAMAMEGLRVLAIARGYFDHSTLPVQQHDFDFEFLGVIGLADPIRAAVPDAVAECYAAGVRVVMLTGDYPATARNIARQVGLRPREIVVTGAELDALTDAALRKRVRDVNVFARMVPEQKLRLVQALQANGEVVAMTGDGVNDAPALKAAHIGIAMGARGTDVAREAAALVLLDDDFSSIVAAVRMGRRIYDNLKKAMAYIFAVHVPIAGMALIPLLLGWPLVLLPVHIVFLELIIDPACSIAFEAEPEERSVMRRPPRDSRRPMFSPQLIALGLAQGASVLAISLASFALAIHLGHDELMARSLSFTALIAGNLSLIFTNRSWSDVFMLSFCTRNIALWLVVLGALSTLAVVLYVPSVSTLFRFGAPHLGDVALAVVAGAASVIWFEGLKLIWRRQAVAN